MVRSSLLRTHEACPPAVAVVIGRAGSKGLPRKNVLPIAGRPMIAHSIVHAIAAATVNMVYCSTDGVEIAEAADAAGATVVMRPQELAGDMATVDSAVRHALENVEDESKYVVILYGNVPIRPEGLIDRAMQRLMSTGAHSVQSYAPVGKHHPYWAMHLDSKDHVSYWQENSIHRRQDLPDVFVPDGGVIAVTRESLFQVDAQDPHAFLGKDRRGIRNARGAVVDVDEEIDLRVAEAMFQLEASSEVCT